MRARVRPLYLTGTKDAPIVAWRSCDGSHGDGITELGLYAVPPDFNIDKPPPALWRILAQGDAVAREIRVGDSPQGFTTTIPLKRPLSSSTTYAVLANYHDEDQVLGYVKFQLRQLRPGHIVFSEGTAESGSHYAERNGHDFGCWERDP